ncbi:MAG: IS110 family transposase [Opitutaceae bacterium]|nr:IS110 family transposase [Opitutaceae bacterium]
MSGTPSSFEQIPQGFALFLKRLPSDTVVICEATGGYERTLVAAHHAANIPVAVVIPRLVRYPAKSIKLLAKNDPIDARLFSRFGQAHADTLRLTQPRLLASLETPGPFLTKEKDKA